MPQSDRVMDRSPTANGWRPLRGRGGSRGAVRPIKNTQTAASKRSGTRGATGPGSKPHSDPSQTPPAPSLDPAPLPRPPFLEARAGPRACTPGSAKLSMVYAKSQGGVCGLCDQKIKCDQEGFKHPPNTSKWSLERVKHPWTHYLLMIHRFSGFLWAMIQRTQNHDRRGTKTKAPRVFII